MPHIGTFTFKDIYHVDIVLVQEFPCRLHSISVALKRECLMPSRKVSPVPTVSIGLLGLRQEDNVFHCSLEAFPYEIFNGFFLGFCKYEDGASSFLVTVCIKHSVPLAVMR